MEENNKDGKRKSKFGRKKLSEGKIRNKGFDLYYNEKECQYLKELFEKSNEKHFRVFLRELTLSQAAKIKFQPEINKDLRIEIRRMGVNLNQIAQKLNQHFGSVTASEISQKIGQIEEELKVILKKTEGK